MRLGQRTLEHKLKHAKKSNDMVEIHNIFEEIYTTYGKLVYFIIAKYVNNKNDVAELTQDVFVSFYNNIFNIEVSNIKYYLAVSAKNKAIDYLKRDNDIVIVDDQIIYEKEDVFNSNVEYERIIDKMKYYLNEFEIDLIIKHNINGYTFKELSKQYNKPVNTLLSIYNRGLKKFKEGSADNERK